MNVTTRQLGVPRPLGSYHARGVLLLVAAAVLWSLNGLLIKALQSAGAGGCTIACGRSLFAAAFLAPWALRRWKPVADKPWVAATVLAFTAMTISFVLATTLTTAANAIILQYTAPAWVFLLSPWILAEPASRRHWMALGGAMAGVAVIFVSQFATEAVGLVVGLGSGLVFGIQTVLMRRVRALRPVVLAFLVCAGSGVALLPVAALVEATFPTTEQLYLLALMGAVQFGVPYVLYSAGIARVSAQETILIVMLEPVLNPVWVWLGFGEEPATATLIGGAIILISIISLSLFRRPVGAE